LGKKASPSPKGEGMFSNFAPILNYDEGKGGEKGSEPQERDFY